MNGNVNGASGGRRTQSTEPLERQHFDLTAQLFELRTKLRSRQGVTSGQVGHLRKQAQELETRIELLELAMGVTKVEAHATQRAAAEPPRSRKFLEAFYAAAKQQLPSALVTRLEQATERPET